MELKSPSPLESAGTGDPQPRHESAKLQASTKVLPRRWLTRRKWLGSALAGAAVVGVATSLKHRNTNAVAGTGRQGLLRIGYAVERPYAFVDGERVTGACAETARLIAARMSVHLEWVQTHFDALIPDLQDRRFDVICAGMFITPERAALVRFAPPELIIAAGLLVRHDAPHPPRDYSDLSGVPARRTATLAGSVEERMLRVRGVEGILSVPDPLVGAKAVQTGVVDALALSWPSVRQLAQRDPALKAIRVENGSSHLVAAAFRRSDTALLNAWSEAEAATLRTPAHLQAISTFGFEPADVPSARSAS